MISGLDRKLLRDMRHLLGQAVAVGLVMACGLAMMIMSRSLVRSLDAELAQYYERHRFADVFAQLKRAPNTLAAEIGAIHGVVAVETAVARYVTLDLPEVAEPAAGLIQSLPEYGEPVLNRLFLRVGRLPETQRRHEVVVGEAFADANHLRPGDRVAAIINGRKIDLHITGIVLSPEYVFESRPGAALPDNRTFGVFWMPYEELATTFSLDGAFNKVSVSLAPGVAESGVIAEIDRLLAPYGGLGAYGREHHPSHARVRDEIQELRVLAIAYPIVFLSVAAFMVHAVMSRQIALQREQIAILKAFGYSNLQVGLHFMKFSLAIVVLGIGLGTIGGFFLGGSLVDLYHQFFRFPALVFRPALGSILAAALVSALAAFVGVFSAVRKAVRLPPAEAMRPEPPASYRRALVERLGFARWFGVSLRMALRNIERKPVNAALTCLALALATGLLIVPSAFRDGIEYVLDYQWDVVQRHQATLALVEPAAARTIADFRSLPGVILAEPFRSAPVELQAGQVKRRLSIQGLPAGALLNRVFDAAGYRIALPPHGIVVSAKLADVLGVKPGDSVEMRVLDGRRPVHGIRVAALAEDFAGMAAYADLDLLNRLLGEGDRMSGAHVTVAAAQWGEFLAALKETPRIGGVAIKDTMRNSFRETTARSIGLIQTIYLVFATTVAFGIVYNSARISLSERSRELATLRVVGFTHREVGAVLVGELAILTLLALPVGLAIGVGLATAIMHMINTELVRLPLVLTQANFAFAALVVSVAATLSALWVSRRLRHLDLVGVLKAQD
jgi:putative ABC transport system permease protein